MKNTHWKNKRVLVTGHTGFKGGWLCLWLNQLGAEVYGVALDPPTNPNLFTIANIKSLLTSDARIDIRDHFKLAEYIHSCQPEIIFHMAAQPLVQYSYHFPIETYAVNVMGTAHVLEAIQTCDSVRAAVIITTDKCYENYENKSLYKEEDRLGGVDPYSSSKACAELVTAAYRSSYFSENVNIATARAGNVIGGGDWAANRLIPDCIRAYFSKEKMQLRYPHSVRPWQHVLESINGYISLAECLLDKNGPQFAEAWNFGPESEDMQTVGEIASKVCQLLNIPIDISLQKSAWHEAKWLRLDSAKAKECLNWYPRWHLHQAIDETIKWYRHWIDGGDMLTFSQSQIEHYLQSHKSFSQCLQVEVQI